jgi:FkbM family methyltransferase
VTNLGSLSEWLLQPEGITLKDKFAISVAKFTYYALLRPILRLILGTRSNMYLNSKNLSFGSFSPFDVRVRYHDLVIHVRHGDDDLSNFSPKHERKITQILTNSLNNGDVFIDVGAHIGKYALIASKNIKNGRIIAIEPNPSTFLVLMKNIELNRVERLVDCINVALNDIDGTVKFYVNKKRSSTCSIVESANVAGYVDVRCLRLDTLIRELNLSRIDWLLIDVEGAEDRVLISGKNVLPIINNMIVEVHSKANLAFIKDLLSQDFDVREIEEGMSRLHLFASRKQHTAC